MRDNRTLLIILGVLGVLIVAVLVNQSGSDNGNQHVRDSGNQDVGMYDNLPFEYGAIIPAETSCDALQEIFDAADNAHTGRIDAGDLDIARAFTRTMEAA